MNDVKKTFDELTQLEDKLTFDSFSHEDALKIGLSINENAKKYSDPISIEITLNGLVVFRYFSDGAVKDSELWLSRKRNSVDLMSMASLRFMYWLELNGETVEGRKLNPNDYAAGGGGFPIKLRGTGLVGSICVSGLSSHFDDHKLIVDTLTGFFK